MKSDAYSTSLIEDQETKERLLHNCSHGITKRLLEKYKPSKGLMLIDGEKKDERKKMAA